MKIVILTFGTRGDVQPYIALGAGLRAAGHTVTLATVDEFQTPVHSAGLEFARLRGDFLKVAQSPDGRGNPLKLVGQYVAMARDTLDDEWAAAQDADALVYNCAALGGYHIAEKLGIPAFASFPAPLYSPTAEFPNPFFPFANLGPFNKLSHRFFAVLSPAMYRRPIKEWRQEVLGLPPAGREDQINGQPLPLLYAYSPAVLLRPADWAPEILVTGYWFLDAPSDWQPDPALVDFLAAGPAPVYVGFGSMFMGDAARTTATVLEAVRLSGLRAILATGWGGLTRANAPANVFVIESAPHDWLFPQVAAVVHHGGAGTTAAALRAGVPTFACPFVADQFFWGRRLAALGVGPAPLPQLRLSPARLAAALTLAVTDSGMRQRAAALGAVIRAEDGVGQAVQYINSRL